MYEARSRIHAATFGDDPCGGGWSGMMSYANFLNINRPTETKEGYLMAELTKFGASEVAYHIKHDLRELPDGKNYSNEAIDPSLSGENYSLLDDRCQTASEANKYRKEIEKEVFKYNRKNLVHAVEIAVQCPSDCPAEQKEAFFLETYKYICSTLPMGERCVFVAQVHADERHYSPSGEMISKDHLHVMYVPAVKDSKHDGYEYRLCADQLTKRARLKEFHPSLQKHLDDAGIHATVFRKKEGDGESIGLSVSQLKELTKKTGVALDHSLTIDELSNIINTNVLHGKQVESLRHELAAKQDALEELSADIAEKTKTLDAALQTNEQLERSIADLENKLSETFEHEKELEEKVAQLENALDAEQDVTWGSDREWGAEVSGWGTEEQHISMYEEESLW